MKEKDLEKCLDNLIIKGLIREAEQDNAEFEAAMRNMSDEDFLALIYDTVEEPTIKDLHLKRSHVMYSNAPSEKLSEVAFCVSDGFDESSSDDRADWDNPTRLNQPKAKNSANKAWKIWSAAIASIAAILLIVFVPAHMDMESRLCESALLVSETYMEPSRGSDISSMDQDEVKAMLPELQKQYAISIKQSMRLHGEQSMTITGEQSEDMDDIEYYIQHASPREAGMELVQAYLKLNQKDKAIETLRELTEADDDPEFAEYCRKMLEILD